MYRRDQPAQTTTTKQIKKKVHLKLDYIKVKYPN